MCVFYPKGRGKKPRPQVRALGSCQAHGQRKQDDLKKTVLTEELEGPPDPHKQASKRAKLDAMKE